MSKQRPPSKAQRAQRKYWEHLGQTCRAHGLLCHIEAHGARTGTLTKFEIEQLRRAQGALNNVRHSMIRREILSIIR